SRVPAISPRLRMLRGWRPLSPRCRTTLSACLRSPAVPCGTGSCSTRPATWRECCPSTQPERPAQRGTQRVRSADLVQPHHLVGVARVAERLELVIPRLAQCESQFAVQLEGVGASDLHCVA